MLVTCAHPVLLGGANLVVETLARQLVHAVTASPDKPHHLYIQLDNASDNKSKLVLAYIAALVHFSTFKTVTIMFLLVGHTHNTCDQKFSVIESRLKVPGVKPYCWPRFRDACLCAWQNEALRPKRVELITYNADWQGFLSPHIDRHFARHQVDSQSGEDIHVFHVCIPNGKTLPRLFYQYRAGQTQAWYPRPAQIGELYNGQQVTGTRWEHPAITSRNQRFTPQDSMWVLSFDDNK